MAGEAPVLPIQWSASGRRSPTFVRVPRLHYADLRIRSTKR